MRKTLALPREIAEDHDQLSCVWYGGRVCVGLLSLDSARSEVFTNNRTSSPKLNNSLKLGSCMRDL
eukprot:2162216-Amphidinium_carterae.1